MASEIEKLQLEEAEAMEALAAEGAELLKQSEALEQRRLSIQAKFESERESLRSSTSAEAPPPPPVELSGRVHHIVLSAAPSSPTGGGGGGGGGSAMSAAGAPPLPTVGAADLAALRGEAGLPV